MASNGVVVDASVILKWYLRDEDLLSEADQLFLDWRGGRLVLIEPAHVGHEVGHSLLRAHRRGRSSAPLAEQAVADFTVLSPGRTAAECPIGDRRRGVLPPGRFAAGSPLARRLSRRCALIRASYF